MTRYVEPETGGGGGGGDGVVVRCDSGVVEGSEISIHYDPMISKVIAHAPTREAAIDKLCEALDEYMIQGVSPHALAKSVNDSGCPSPLPHRKKEKKTPGCSNFWCTPVQSERLRGGLAVSVDGVTRPPAQVTHNIPFLRSCLSHPRFKSGEINTDFIKDEFPEGFLGQELTEESYSKLAGAMDVRTGFPLCFHCLYCLRQCLSSSGPRCSH